MKKKRSISFTFLVVAIILGVTIYKQFDFEKLKFEKPALAIVYIIVFLVSIYILVRKPKAGSEK